MSAPDPTPGPSGIRKRTRDINFLNSPMKKRPKHTDMTSNEKMIAINIYKYLEKSAPTYPVKKEIVKTTAEIVGTSERTIYSILNEYKTTGKVSTPDRSTPKYEVVKALDDFTLSAIRRKVHQFFIENELPTISKVLKIVNDDEDLPNFSRSTMYKIMKKLKFKYAKRARKSILLDRPDLVEWRTNYLMKIKDFRREKRKIYYTDETWVNEGHTSNYVWVDEDIKNSRQAFLNGLTTGLKNPQKGRRLIVTHIGSTDGFLEGGEWIFEAKKTDREGDYHGEMDAHNFEKWFKKILELVEPGSVIVLDNAPYHSRLAELLPNLSWRKDKIQSWLRAKQILYNENEYKSTLLKKIDKEKYKRRVVDEMAAAKNITNLRIPPYHCELNPIELIWAQLKGYVGKNNKTFKMAELKNLTREAITKITAESWRKCIEHVIKEENKMQELDGLIDTATTDEATATPTPSFIIHVSASSSNETHSATDSEY